MTASVDADILIHATVTPDGVLWTAHLTDTEMRALYSPDFGPHLPYMIAIVIGIAALRTRVW